MVGTKSASTRPSMPLNSTVKCAKSPPTRKGGGSGWHKECAGWSFDATDWQCKMHTIPSHAQGGGADGTKSVPVRSFLPLISSVKCTKFPPTRKGVADGTKSVSVRPFLPLISSVKCTKFPPTRKGGGADGTKSVPVRSFLPLISSGAI